MISVNEVAAEMGVDLPPAAAWSVGAIIRERYAARAGELPAKELRRKKSGAGSHCFAVYPEAMREEIARVIREHAPGTSPQGSLF